MALKVSEKNPLKITVLETPTNDKHFIYAKLYINTVRDPKVVKPGMSLGGEYILEYKERIEPYPPEPGKENEECFLLVDGEVSWFKGMGTYLAKKKNSNEMKKEIRLSVLTDGKTEEEINKKIRLAISDAVNSAVN